MWRQFWRDKWSVAFALFLVLVLAVACTGAGVAFLRAP